jgi:hypothetical protein
MGLGQSALVKSIFGLYKATSKAAEKTRILSQFVAQFSKPKSLCLSTRTSLSMNITGAQGFMESVGVLDETLCLFHSS